MRKSKQEEWYTRRRIIKPQRRHSARNGHAGTGLSGLMAAAKSLAEHLALCSQRIATARIEGDSGKVPFCCVQARNSGHNDRGSYEFANRDGFRAIGRHSNGRPRSNWVFR